MFLPKDLLLLACLLAGMFRVIVVMFTSIDEPAAMDSLARELLLIKLWGSVSLLNAPPDYSCRRDRDDMFM